MLGTEPVGVSDFGVPVGPREDCRSPDKEGAFRRRRLVASAEDSRAPARALDADVERVGVARVFGEG